MQVRGVFSSATASAPRHSIVGSQLKKPLQRWAIPRPGSQLGALQTRWMCAEAEPEEASATRRGEVTLDAPAHEQRLDKFLLLARPNMTLSLIMKLIR
jgi:hypothetical protein